MNILEYLVSKFGEVKVNVKGNAIMPCPFHNDHFPGHFNMDTKTGVWHCFHASCLAGGNFRKFLEMTDSLRYIEAITFIIS